MVDTPDFATLKERAKRKLERDMGPLLMSALNDPHTVEIMLNADGRLWQERLGEKMKCIGTLRVAQSEAIIKTVAGYHGKEVTHGKPLLEGELPLDGSRFSGQLPPVVAFPTFAIRKKAVSVFTLEQYVACGIMRADQHEALKAAVQAHRNILVIGGTGSGKTTLVNAIILEMVLCDPSERVFIIEDTGESSVPSTTSCSTTRRWRFR
jgi:P-type conjugative transfer ATPase TrbB